MTKPNLCGLAFTSPGVIVIAIDRKEFKVHLFKTGQLAQLQLFVNSEDTRKTIILVSSVFDLKQIQDIKNIHSFILFEDIEVMKKIQGINILDIVNDGTEWKRVTVTSTKLNAALREIGNSFTITEESISYEQELTSEITFRHLISDVVKKLESAKNKELVDNFVEYACKYTVGLVAKRSWTTKVRKPLLATKGISVETLVELEKWFATDFAKTLGKSYYKMAEEGLSLDEATKKLKPNLEDLKYIINLIGMQQGQKYNKKS